MGAHRTCEKYQSAKTPRGTELRCKKFSKAKGKAKCHPGLKGGPRSPGLIHPSTCGQRKRRAKR